MTHVVLSDLSVYLIDEIISGSSGLFRGSLEECEKFVTEFDPSEVYPNYPDPDCLEELDPRDYAEIDDFGNEI